MPPPNSIIPQSLSRKRQSLPLRDDLPTASTSTSKPSSPSTAPLSSPDPDDTEYAPSRGKRRAGGKGGSSRPVSREALRKANHSLIERRRREKINYALGELRGMVPGLGDTGGGKGGEFKLEVLERTVGYMKELKQRIEDLEARLGEASEASHKATKRRVRPASREELESDGSEGRDIDIPAGPSIKSSDSPPTPTLSPEDHQDDPDETEPEPNLPPPLAFASEPAHSPRQPSIASLLAAASARSQQVPSQPAPPPEATNPTLYLPFPTPSPTSPFLTYHSTTSTTTSATGPAEPSPFLAPLQNMSLFGGALNLDHSNPNISPTQSFHPKHPSPPEMPPSRDIPAEEAANLLLAFSSPDTLRGATPKIRPAGVKERRSTLESEEFVLDGGVARESARGRKDGKEIETGRGTGMVGKTARDILRM